MNPIRHQILFPMIYIVCWGQLRPSKIIGGGGGGGGGGGAPLHLSFCKSVSRSQNLLENFRNASTQFPVIISDSSRM